MKAMSTNPITNLERRTSLDDRLSRVLEELLQREPFDLECVKQVKEVLFEVRESRHLHNTKCVRSLCYGSRCFPERLVTLALLLSHLIMKDENDCLFKSGDMFLHSQKNFLAIIERLYSGGSFKGQEKVLVQILFTQLKNGALEPETLIHWLRRPDSYSSLSEENFQGLKTTLSTFTVWVQSTLETSDEDDDEDNIGLHIDSSGSDEEDDEEDDLFGLCRRGSTISNASIATLTVTNIANADV
eukprot:m.89923 g.89923  ORF g.89923 m.89923 type:complete len:243 (+) comp8841_c5_seq2:148-876(+)